VHFVGLFLSSLLKHGPKNKMAVILFFKETNYDHYSKLTLKPLFGKLAEEGKMKGNRL